MLRYILFFCITPLLFASQLDTFQKKALELKLYEERYWKLLLHMPGSTSEIDDPRFFFSPEGKHDAKAELLATLHALFNEERRDDNATRCKFPARTQWLIEKLGITDLPKAECKEFNDLIKRLDPQSLSYIFPAGHINSPASMFGHTFIRIDSSYSSKMLSHAINYTAHADPSKENGFVFAVKGLIGGYKGEYSLLPYYEKIKEYRDGEQRDLWEYDLNLSREEIIRMVSHIWEIVNMYSDYYFFDENCSYNMLWLLEIARPTVHLREHFIYQVAPTATIFAVEAEGLVKKKVYRPSKRTVLERYEKELSDPAKGLVKQLATGKASSPWLLLSPQYTKEQKQRIMEASIELTEFNYMSTDINKSQYLDISHQLRQNRAKMGASQDLLIKTPHNPDAAHRSFRVSLQHEVNHDNERQLLGIRPSYHDIKDSDIGFLNGTGIEFFNMVFFYDKINEKIETEKMTLISITSLAPSSYFVTPLNWRIDVGWDRDYLDNRLYFHLNGGPGTSVALPWGYGYFLLEPNLINADETIWALRASLGTVIYSGDRVKTHLELNRRYFDNGYEQDIVTFTQNWRLTQNSALQLSYEYRERFYRADDRFSLILNTFF